MLSFWIVSRMNLTWQLQLDGPQPNGTTRNIHIQLGCLKYYAFIQHETMHASGSTMK